MSPQPVEAVQVSGVSQGGGAAAGPGGKEWTAREGGQPEVDDEGVDGVAEEEGVHVLPKARREAETTGNRVKQ